MRRYGNYGWIIISSIVFLVLIFGGKLIQLYTDWLWFSNLGYSIVFTKSIITGLWLALAFGALFFALVYANLWLARKLAPPPTIRFGEEIRLGERLGNIARSTLGILLFAGTLVFSGLVALEAASHWDDFLRFANALPFGVKDPLFNKDIGFYIFKLPFIRYIYSWLFFALIAAALATAALHYASEAIEFFANTPQFAPKVKAHLSVLLSSLFFLKAWGYRLDRYELLYQPGGLIFGGGYADINARLMALNILFIAAILAGVLILMNIRRRGVGLAIVAFVGLVGLSLVVGSIYPSTVQQFVVKPNEFDKEKQFIEWNIKFTRVAYGLDNIRRQSYPVSSTLTAEQLRNNHATLENIRIWDYQPLLTAYGQLQEIQQYYKFLDADVDRYTVNGRIRQLLLSARELSKDSLPENAQTWVNRRLQYTHGYGITVSPVNEVSGEGMPTFFVKDIPPRSDVDIKITRPEIYFGEMTDDHVVIKTDTKEFDYPEGDTNVFTKYDGDAGIPIANRLRKILFALRFSDINMVLSSNIRNDSKLLFRRNIKDRAKTIFPFLRFDNDPYIVASEGKLYWFIDAYTYTNRYPYSRPVNTEINYIRNSVKVVIDAYTGEVTAYVADANDPILKVYNQIFPGITKPLSDMPKDLLAHIRYPEDLFRIQSAAYTTYHMKDPQVFYNKGDLWTIPRQTQAADGNSNSNVVEPYYLLTKLPDEDKLNFLLLTPLTRANKDNMVAWLAAKCDPDNYGDLVVYDFPKGELVFGPAQIAARANQDASISQQLTLWNQQGSAVIRGTLLAVPIEQSILYVEPIYLESTATKIPELKRVIVALGSKIAMEPTLQEALARVVGAPVSAVPGQDSQPTGTAASTIPGLATPQPPAKTSPTTAAPEVGDLVRRARQQYSEAERRQRDGDWAGYGRALNELNKTLQELENRTR